MIKILRPIISPRSILGMGLILLSNSALAVPITQWTFVTESAFTAFDDQNPGALNETAGSLPNAVLGLGPPITFGNDAPTQLSWGDPGAGNQSSLSVQGNGSGVHPGQSAGIVMTGNLMTGPLFQQVATLTLDNNVIQENTGELNTARLTSLLTLMPLVPLAVGSVGPLPLFFDITYEETSGDAIFVVDIAGAGFDPLTSILEAPFSFMDTDYNVTLLITGLSTLNDGACTAAGAGPGCTGFVTPENGSSQFDLSFGLIEVPQVRVPEPPTTLLMMAGLLGLVVSRRMVVTRRS